MSSTPLAALAVWACCLSASAAPARRPAPGPAKPAPAARLQPAQEDQRLGVVQKRIDALIAETNPVMDKLGGLRRLYADGDLDALGSQREPLVRELESKREAIRDQIDEFKTLRREFQFRQGAAIISAIAGGGSADVQASLRQVIDYDNYPKQVSHFTETLDETLRADRAAFAESQAQRESEKRRRQLAWLLGGGAIAFAAFVAWLARRLRSQAPATLTAVPVRAAPEAAGVLAGPITAGLPRATAVPQLGAPVTTPLPRRPEPQVGAVLGGSWRVLAPPSQTPLGNVYAGEEVQGKRPVVIRRVRDELHRNEKDLERFLERARQVAALKHINLCEVYAVFVEDDRVHIVTERVDGRAVADFLEPGRRINPSSVKRVLLQVARVVDHAHQQKVLHGDLTPSCVVVTREGLAKVSDFGIGIEARKIAAKLSWSEPIGSPAYLAPEQELGTTFKESDVFALGVLLYEMTTGALPFEGPNFLAQKRERLFRPPSQAAPGLPKELDAIVTRALAPEPQHRYRSAADFATALEKLPDS